MLRSTSSATPATLLALERYRRFYFYSLDERGHLYTLPSVEHHVKPSSVSPTQQQSATPTQAHQFAWFDLDAHFHIAEPQGPTFLKDKTFLNTFFRNLKPNPILKYVPDKSKYYHYQAQQLDHSHMSDTATPNASSSSYSMQVSPSAVSLAHMYPYASACQNELNFLTFTDTPVVYHSHIANTDHSNNSNNNPTNNNNNNNNNNTTTNDNTTSPYGSLVYGGDLTVPFYPSRMSLVVFG
jgi:hypothetical protein